MTACISEVLGYSVKKPFLKNKRSGLLISSQKFSKNYFVMPSLPAIICFPFSFVASFIFFSVTSPSHSSLCLISFNFFSRFKKNFEFFPFFLPFTLIFYLYHLSIKNIIKLPFAVQIFLIVSVFF